MFIFLAIGAAGIVLLLLALILDDLLDGVLGSFGGEWFTGATLAGFLGALGFIGALILSATDNTVLATVGGSITGLVLAALVGWVTHKLRATNTDDTPKTAALVGRTGVVINDIPDNGYGEIRLTAGGHLTKLHARADRALPAGTEVWILENLSPTSVRVQSVHD